MKVVFSVSLIIMFFHSTHGSANCEIGAYSIHTVGEYPHDKKGENNFVSYSIEVEKGGKIDISGDSLGPLKNIKEITIQAGKDICRASRSKADSGFFNYDQKSCPFLNNWQTTGYGLLDKIKKQVSLPKELKIESGIGLSILEDKIKKIIPDLKLYAKADISSQNLEAPLKLDDMIKYSFEHKRAGTMVMSILNITLKNIKKYYPNELSKIKRVNFPVIFLTNDGESPRYIADGANCADYRVNLEYNSISAAADRFHLDAAFDLNNDNQPDVLRVNEVIIYGITKSHIWILEEQSGC